MVSVSRATYLGQESKNQMGRDEVRHKCVVGEGLSALSAPPSAVPGGRTPAALSAPARSCTRTPPSCTTLTGTTAARWSPPASATSSRTPASTSAPPTWGPGSSRCGSPSPQPSRLPPSSVKPVAATCLAERSLPPPTSHPGEPDLAERTFPERSPVQRGL